MYIYQSIVQRGIYLSVNLFQSIRIDSCLSN